MKKLLFLLLLPVFNQLKAQPAGCVFNGPFVAIHFGAGSVKDLNQTSLTNYSRVAGSCPTDGYYSFTSVTSNCFRGDWHTLLEDHTQGDKDGNMLLVNAAPDPGTFLKTTVSGLKGATTYEFGVWLMNVCRITDKCPFPLLPNITIQLYTKSGQRVTQFNTGNLARRTGPQWTQYRAQFNMPVNETELVLTMNDNAPGGCGNDFALDDITFRQCVLPKPTVVTKRINPPAIPKKQKEPTNMVAKKVTEAQVKTNSPVKQITAQNKELTIKSVPIIAPKVLAFSPPPSILTTRENPLIKQIEMEAGQIKLDLYDNGEIDGDTVSIYHNNQLLVSKAKLSQKPVSFTLSVDSSQPHHELIMVAENLGSIPPNTSLMIITSGTKRYQVFISSTEQKNAKVVIDLKQ